MFRGACFAYLLCLSPAVAETAHQDAREIAQCGYLTFIAAEQLHETNAEPATVDAMVDDLVDFSAIYAALTTTETLDQPARITPELLISMNTLGHEMLMKRISSMSQANAVKLSNRLLQDCRADLRLFEAKLRAN